MLDLSILHLSMPGCHCKWLFVNLYLARASNALFFVELRSIELQELNMGRSKPAKTADDGTQRALNFNEVDESGVASATAISSISPPNSAPSDVIN